jgi:hypothetical protein
MPIQEYGKRSSGDRDRTFSLPLRVLKGECNNARLGEKNLLKKNPGCAGGVEIQEFEL